MSAGPKPRWYRAGRGTLRWRIKIVEIDGGSAKSLPAEMEKELDRRIGIIDVDFDVSD